MTAEDTIRPLIRVGDRGAICDPENDSCDVPAAAAASGPGARSAAPVRG